MIIIVSALPASSTRILHGTPGVSHENKNECVVRQTALSVERAQEIFYVLAHKLVSTNTSSILPPGNSPSNQKDK